ncbi:S8 family peptidase [Deinococcus yavapaiensis]|uniref:Subtilisin family serine protease n=1 Tax=Deinococcus yavapaiensis KR-236 TaxID=694435 RepID=A0A318S3H9_9DEIO|nr:S8 family serine peptidase [Deinococcus yavapaiensis]PYE52942.1 subtilisin family serine protease [Deinococcus yavapaiensis KR-236]
MHRILASALTITLSLAATAHAQKDAPAFSQPATVKVIATDVPLATLAVNSKVQPAVSKIEGVDGGPSRLVGRVIGASGASTDLVKDEVIVRTDDKAALEAFVQRWNGDVLTRTDFRKAGLDMPAQYLVRVDTSNVDAKLLPELARKFVPSVTGSLVASDEATLRIVALALQEKANGLDVSVNPLVTSQSVADRRATDGPFASPVDGEFSPNAFSWPYLRSGGTMDIGVTEAWRKLRLRGVLGENDSAAGANRVKVLVMDAGFNLNADYPASRTLFPADAWGRPNTWGCNTGPGCEFHGTHVVQALAGQLDNNFGAAGPGAPVVDLLMAQSPSADVAQLMRYFTLALPAALSERPFIVNASFAFELDPLLTPVGDAFGVFFSSLRRAGMLVFVSAGNRGIDVDAMARLGSIELPYEALYVVPCENDGVICVGGLDWNTNRKAREGGGSNFGQVRSGDSGGTVDIFAPFDLWLGSNTAGGPSSVSRLSGTSFSSPFVAGVAALVKAANPSLSANEVERILMTTAHTGSPDSRVPRWVNANLAVSSVLGDVCELPSVTITSPAASVSVPVGSPVTFNGFGTDSPGLGRSAPLPASSLTWLENGTAVASGGTMTRTYTTTGSRTVRLVGRGCSAVSASATVMVNVVPATAAPNSAQILAPSVGTTVMVDLRDARGWYLPVQLIGRATNADGTATRDERLRWTISRDGRTVATAFGRAPTVNLYNNEERTLTYDIVLDVLDERGVPIAGLRRATSIRLESVPG